MAKAPVKLMLDRKEEHLDTGNRPSATAHIRAGVTADGTLTAFDGQSWGTGGAGAPSGLPAAVHLQLPEPQAHAQGRLHQRRPAARDARAGTSAGLLPDRNPDGRARRSREDGSGRVPREEPAAGRARTRCGRSTSRAAPRRSAGTSAIRPAIAHAGPIKTGMGVSAHRWGGARPRLEGAHATSPPTAAW